MTEEPCRADGLADVVLEARCVSKRYPGQVALDDVTFRAVRGAVNVLIGENGAGKSTLMRLLAGVERADSGTLLLDGAAIVLGSPRDAARVGIGIVHQELALLPNLDVTDNIFAGRELVRGAGWIDRREEERRGGAALGRMREPMAADTAVEALSLGRRQVVELARSMTHGARVLILDEPTSALSSAEAETLFAVLAQLKQDGVTVIYISHRLQELLHLGDTFTVLRGGRVVGNGSRGEVDRAWIVERMSGRAAGACRVVPPRPAGIEAVRTRGLCGRGVHGVDLHVCRGEIVGIYGLLGSGRTELLESLAGVRPCTGELWLGGRAARLRTVADAMRLGVVLVPEDRQRDGLVPDLSVRENIALGAGGTVISKAEESQSVRALAQKMQLKAPDLEALVTTLSGGGQQKVVLARCLMARPGVLLLDEPTRGVDVGAKAEIYAILRGLAAEGMAVLFTSSEIEETRELADRVLVMRQGSIGAELTRAEATDAALFAAASPAVVTREPSGRSAA